MSSVEMAPPVDAAEQVAALPQRVAHATYALLAWDRDHPYGPHRVGDVVLYDSEAPSASATGHALLRAVREYGLVDRWGLGLYTPTNAGRLLFPALEERFLDESGPPQDQSGGWWGVSKAPGWKIFLRSGRVLEIKKDATRLRVELDRSAWLDYEQDCLSNRIRVAEIESVHRLIEFPAEGGTDG